MSGPKSSSYTTMSTSEGCSYPWSVVAMATRSMPISYVDTSIYSEKPKIKNVHKKPVYTETYIYVTLNNRVWQTESRIAKPKIL